MTAPASARGWGPGWPHNNASKCVEVQAGHSGVRLLVRAEIAPLVKYGLDEVESRGYLYDYGPKDVNDDWGYSNRPIAGTSVPSNHSWGLAIDLDAQDYPQGQTKVHPPQWIMDIWSFLGFDNGVVWSHPDPMHYEYRGTPADAHFMVSALAARAQQGTVPTFPTRTPLGIPTNRPILHLHDAGRFVEIAQWELAAINANAAIHDAVGYYGDWMHWWVNRFGAVCQRPDWDGTFIDTEVWAALDLSYIKTGNERGETWAPPIA